MDNNIITRLENELVKKDYELQKQKLLKDKFARTFLEYIENIGVEEAMRTLYEDSEYNGNYHRFCKEYCPFEECKWNCFEKEQNLMCEERECKHCIENDNCADAFTGIGSDYREGIIPDAYRRNT